jgi:Cu/Ag efflux protein CusF
MLAVSAAALAADETHSGKVKTASADQIVVSHENQDHTFQVDSATMITLDGKEAKATDLKAGDKVTVTAKQAEGGGLLATKVVATRST